jgi:general secretion pathway protein K
MRDRRGIALMLVLWVVVVLAAIASGVVIAARRQVAVVSTDRARGTARYAAESGVEAVKAELRASFRRSRSPEAQARIFERLEATVAEWGERPLGVARFQVAVVDLGARIDLNAADEEVLHGLFRQFVGEDGAAALVDALEDWKDEDDGPREFGAEAAEYERAGSLFFPPNAPLLRLDELTRIAGFDDTLAVRLAPYVTVQGDGLLNVNTAPETVLAAVPELGPDGADLIVSARRRGELLASAMATQQLLRESGVGRYVRRTGLVTMPSRVLVVSRGWAEGAPLTHEIQAVLEIGDLFRPEGPTLTVVHWTERDR